MVDRKRRISGPVAAPVESKGDVGNTRTSAEESTVIVASKADPTLWGCAKRTSTRALETETDAERRRNIEACLEYVMENGYPHIDEVFIAMGGVVEHLTMDDFLGKDWKSLAVSGRKDEAFVLAGPDYGPDVEPPNL